MALSQDRKYSIVTDYGHQERLPVKANVVIYKGAMVQFDDTGYLDPALTATTPKSCYVAVESIDTTGLADGDEGVMCLIDGLAVFPAGAVLAVANAGRFVYATDDETFALTGPNTPVGRITSVRGNEARVLLRG